MILKTLRNLDGFSQPGETKRLNCRPELRQSTGTMQLPPFRFGELDYTPQGKPVVLLFPSGDAFEFNSVEGAKDYLDSARRAGAAGADQTALFECQNGQWYQLE